MANCPPTCKSYTGNGYSYSQCTRRDIATVSVHDVFMHATVKTICDKS